MSPRHLRSTSQPSRSVAPVHRGPQAAPSPSSAGSVVAGAMPPQAPNAALLIDFDNVTMGIRSDLQEELKNLLSSDIIKGKVAVRRAYADWRRYPQYIVPLTEASIDLIFAPAYGSAKKNATDIRLAIDALELVFTRPEIGTFVLLSGDSDFSSMVIKLKEYGKYVIGVGIRESSSDLLVMNCDEYYSYNALAGLVRTSDEETVRWDPWELVTESVQRMKRNGDVMRSDRLKQVMQEIDSQFDEKNLGMSKFSRFVQEAQARGLLTVSRLESGQLEIGLPPDQQKADETVSGDAQVTDAAAPAVAVEEIQKVSAEESREDRNKGRRGRRGRGRDRDERPAPAAVVEAEKAEVATDSTSSTTATTTAEPAPVAAAAPSTHSSSYVNRDSIGLSGEKLTRAEALDLVKRSVASLVKGVQSTTATAVRVKAYKLLGRDSETLAASMFERILRDAHDAELIDLRRRGEGYEVGLVSDAAPIAEQLASKEAELVKEQKAAASAAAGNVPRGLGMRGRAPVRGGARGGPPPELLMVGVVSAKPTAVDTPEPVVKTPEPVAEKAQPEAFELVAESEPKAKPARKSATKKSASKVAGKKEAAPARKKTAARKSAASGDAEKVASAPVAKRAAPAKKTAAKQAAKTSARKTAARKKSS